MITFDFLWNSTRILFVWDQFLFIKKINKIIKISNMKLFKVYSNFKMTVKKNYTNF